MKTNSVNQIMEMQAEICNSFFLIEVSYKRAENELSRDFNILFEIQIPPAKWLVGTLSLNCF